MYKFALIDWKTSNSLNKSSYIMQVSAYQEALREMTGLKPEELIIIRLDKHQAKYDAIKIIDPKSALKSFLSIARVYDWLNTQKVKMVSCNPKEIISLLQ
jgi:hypothetical protein